MMTNWRKNLKVRINQCSRGIAKDFFVKNNSAETKLGLISVGCRGLGGADIFEDTFCCFLFTESLQRYTPDKIQYMGHRSSGFKNLRIIVKIQLLRLDLSRYVDCYFGMKLWLLNTSIFWVFWQMSACFYRTQVSLGSNLWVRLSVTDGLSHTFDN